MSNAILIVAHSDWREGRLDPLLRAKGYSVTWCCPAGGEDLPVDHGEFAGTVVLGGLQSANDAESQPYLRREIDWIQRHLTDDHRFLGICLGAQLLARALDARVQRHPEGLNEIGYYPIRPTPAGAELIPFGLQVYHWHQEGFEVPKGAELLASGDTFPNQAYRYGSSIYGLQFHPEVTTSVAKAWIGSAADHLARPGAQTAEQQLAASSRYDAPLHGWLDRFLDHWLAAGAARSAAE